MTASANSTSRRHGHVSIMGPALPPLRCVAVMMAVLVEAANRVALGLSERRRPVSGHSLRINCGSGLRVAPGWVNVDASPAAALANPPVPVLNVAWRASRAKQWSSQDEFIARLKSGRFVHHDIRKRLPFRNVSVACVYASHVLEHLYVAEAKEFIGEVVRVLMPGGLVRLVVPDFDHVLRTYAGGERHKAVELLYSQEVDANRYGRHHWVWYYESLAEPLREVGLHSVCRCSSGEGRVPDAVLLDHAGDESLFVEAEK